MTASASRVMQHTLDGSEQLTNTSSYAVYVLDVSINIMQ